MANKSHPLSAVPPVLDRIVRPADLRTLSRPELDTLAEEIRAVLVHQVGRRGGHLGSNLGVVELTIALHRVFESPHDRIVFDTGHQAYVHKLLTGRAGAFDTLRRGGGLSGYPCRAESVHDISENSHASTALSWADGLAKAHRLAETDRRVVAVLGDGALTGGMAWEALNNLGAAPDRPVIVVLNDNGRSYAPTVGGIAAHLAGLGRDTDGPGSVFTALGLAYLGPVDGHDIEAVEHALRTAATLSRPVVVHCRTEKGRGHAPATGDELHRMHVVPAQAPLGTSRRPTEDWTGEFAAELVRLAERRPDLVGITAAMRQPVGLERLATAHPDRVFDVGIAEQHAVASAAALAESGLHPVVAVYATFLNRAFDQVLMDVALHRLPVTFVLDRAGITGDDGASHNGVWDLSILQVVPGLRIAVPRDGARLRSLLNEAVSVSDGPTALRFPKGAVGRDIPAVDRIGWTDVLAHTDQPDVLIVAVGPMAGLCLTVAARLGEHGIGVTVVDPRWVRPVDPALVELAGAHDLVVTVEDGVRAGGVGAMLAQALRDAEIDVPLRDFGVPDQFLHHTTRAELLADVGLEPNAVTERVLRTVRLRGTGTPHPRLATAGDVMRCGA